jgi:hypothetical protein
MQYRSLLLLLALGACGDNGGGGGDDGVTPDAAAGSPDAVAAWHAPACDSVTGTGAVTFTHDEGATLAPMDQTLTPPTYTFGVVALGPNVVVATSGADVLRSTDAGCTWSVIGASGDGTMVLRAAGDDRAYGFGDNQTALIRVDGDTVTALTAPGNLVGLGVDPANPDHVRVGDSAGQLWDSTDAGDSFTPLGSPPIDDTSLAYRVAFDPADLDHVLVGTLGAGVFVTHDGLESRWGAGTGLSSNDRSNGFNLAVSPADGDVVWVEAYDLSDLDDTTARHIYRSTDGGDTFTAAVDSADAILFNGNPLFPHPTDANVVYFSYGTSYQNYGTDLFRYDAGTDTVTHTHNPFHRVWAAAFLPGDPTWMWLGVSIEPSGGAI